MHPLGSSSEEISIQDLMLIKAEQTIAQKQRVQEWAARAGGEALWQADRLRRAYEEAERQRRREEARRRAEDQARLDAMHLAAMASAEAEARERGRLKLAELQLAHERQLAETEQREGKKELRVILGVAAALVLALGGGAGCFVHHSSQRQLSRIAELKAELQSARQLSARQAELLQQQAAELTALQRRLTDSRGAAARPSGPLTQLTSGPAAEPKLSPEPTAEGCGHGGHGRCVEPP